MTGRSEGASRPSVAVGAARAVDRERIAGIARRLGIDLEEAPPREGAVTIGGRVVPEGVDDWYVEAALVRALEPRHLLFLCVANSARSQLAEGIARALTGPESGASSTGGAGAEGDGAESVGAEGPGSQGDGAPSRVKISSAGSEPTSVRPQAVAVLREIGIDISGQRSNGVDEVERPVDVVVTLCAEEVCPVWLEAAVRVHWGLPDPAAVEGTEEEKLDAFRAVRDELRTRLGVLLSGRPL